MYASILGLLSQIGFTQLNFLSKTRENHINNQQLAVIPTS